MADIDTSKNVYLFTHGRQDLMEKSTNALIANGFSKDKIVIALPSEAGNVCLLYTSPSPRDKRQSRMPSSA